MSNLNSLMRQGLVSGKAASKLKTKVQPSKMADFYGKGSTDEGGRTDKGDMSVASTNHVEQNQRAPKPSKGAQVAGAEGKPDKNHIDSAPGQKKPWPALGKGKKGGGGVKGPAPQPSGPLYGGPNSRKVG